MEANLMEMVSNVHHAHFSQQNKRNRCRRKQRKHLHTHDFNLLDFKSQFKTDSGFKSPFTVNKYFSLRQTFIFNYTPISKSNVIKIESFTIFVLK